MLTDKKLIDLYECFCGLQDGDCEQCKNLDYCQKMNSHILSLIRRWQNIVQEHIEKTTPKLVNGFGLSSEKRIVGYCPTCGGTVDIKLTFLVKHKGHCCSWCGQRIDLTGENNLLKKQK